MPTSPNATSPAFITGSGATAPIGRPSNWEAPFQWDGSSQSQQDRILGWAREAVSDGENFLRTQTGYRFVQVSHRLMADMLDVPGDEALSRTSLNFVKRDIRELVGMLSNPRPIAGFRSENPDYDEQGLLLNKLWISWYQRCFVDRSIRKALQFAAIEGTGYLAMEWDPGYWGTGRGEIKLTAMGVDSVLPIGISPEDWDLQRAYGVVIRRQVPIFELLRRWPHLASRLTPDGESISSWRRLVNGLMDKIKPTVHNTYGSARGYDGVDPAGRQLVTVYDIYLLDGQTNMGTESRPMGLQESPWAYNVPAFGSDLPTGVYDPVSGQELSRRADAHDARLFPYRRHIMMTRNTILYDGTSKFWHGRVPLVQVKLDDSPFEFAGIPLTKEPAKAQAAVTSLLRAYDDSANARMRPPLMYDDARVSPALARSIDPRKGGQVVGLQNMMSEGMKLLVDPRYYSMQADILPFIQWFKEEATKLTGLSDMAALGKAAQIPSGDTIEKLQEASGPLATDMSRNMEAMLREMGEQFKGLAFEFYNARRRWQLFGPDGLTKEDFDYDPGELTPSTLDLPGKGKGGTRAERARAHMMNFEFTITPNSIYQTTQSTRRLLLLQMARMGMPISPYTLMDQFDVPNPGRPPRDDDGKEPSTEIDKWKAWKREELDVMIESQLKMAEAQAAIQAQTMAQNPLGQLSSAIQQAVQAPTAGGGGNPQGQGRPPSGQVNPHVEYKDGGTRTTIAES